MPPRSHNHEFRNSLDVVRDAFTLLVAGPRPLALDGGRFAGLPGRSLPLDEVRDRLLARSCPQATRDEVWAHIVGRSREGDSSWTIGAVGVALPGLTAIATALTARFAGDPGDVHAEVLAGFLTALAQIDLDRPRIMLRLRWAAYRAGHQEVMAALNGPVPVDPSTLPDEPQVPPGNPDMLLVDAVRDGVLTGAEAELIGATRLDKVPLGTWAREHDANLWGTYKARSR
ncbi:hypothetical protein, partial [Kutzneria sp. NPDC052558]|uniref:hypothetical protein n=1 Tax=Kutzneria sp. NPDC052558 TaxID=3364121 RepID=UPI0037C6942D